MKAIPSRLYRLWRRLSRPFRKKNPQRSTAFAWLDYKAPNDGEHLRIYNTTDAPVDTEIAVRGKLFQLIDVGRQVKPYTPKVGEVFFRLATEDEARSLADIRMKALDRENRLKGQRLAAPAKVRATIFSEYRRQLIVVRQGK